ncbi:MAG: glycosyltransferase [Nitrospirota bacterium]
MGNAICTIVSKNYLSYARLLIDSFLKHNEGYDTHVLLVDRVDGYFDPDKEHFKLTTIEELDIENIHSFCFKYNVTELNTAVKPFYLDYLFRNYGYEKIIYFDPDILIMNNLNELFRLLDNHSVILTPHITSPVDDSKGRHFNEVHILLAGTYNLGFIGLSHYEKVKDFLGWWKKRLYKYCFSAPEKGLFVDQKWIDLLPGMLEDVYILRHPGYNIAYWNLHERKVTYTDEEFLVNNHPVYFFHFSGFIFNNIGCISKYQDKYTLDDFKDLRLLFEKYRDLLVQKDYLSVREWPYAFGSFDNGVEISSVIRQLYSGLIEQGKNYGNPFITDGPESFFNWLNMPVVSGKPITNLLHYIYYLRTDLQKAFPDLFGNNLGEFVNWAMNSLKKEYDFDERLIPLNFEETDYQSIVEKTRSEYALRRLHFKNYINNYIKVLLWNYGIKYAKLIKKIPILNIIAFRIYNRLAFEKSCIATTSNADDALRKMIDTPVLEGKRQGVNIAGYLDTESGVAEAARGIIKAFENSGIPWVLNNIEQEFYRRNDKTYTEFSSKNPYPVNIVHVNADQVPFVARSFGDDYFKDRYNIGYWFWELSEFPEEWLPSFSYFNEIWVASDFCLDSISRVSPVPVVKIPPSIATNNEGTFGRDYFGLKHSSFIFLMMFDFLSLFERKNPMAVVDAFKKAFSKEEDATLIIKCSNSSYNHPMLKNLHEIVKRLNVKIIDRYLDKDELHSLINACDCYVSLHRSEGFGLPLAEAMLMGKPVIATGYSGNMEFMNINNSFLVKYSLIEIQEDIGPYKKGAIWADPDISHAAELMRYVTMNREETEKVAQIGAEDIKKYFCPDVIAGNIRQRMKYLFKNIK